MTCSPPILSIICPCFNEQETIALFTNTICNVLNQTAYNYELIFINDGSTDNTLLEMNKQLHKNASVRIINLSRNFGKEAALTAGLDHAQGEVIIPIDVDLQDPPELIHDFLQEWENGFQVVLAKRIDRNSDSLVKKITASLFYKVHNSIADVSIPDNVGDYRLITRQVVEAIQELPENQRFMKGVFSWVGFKTTVVEYTRQPRSAGKTSFNTWKLWNFALDGITSFSTVPLRVWLYLGLICSMSAFCYGSIIVLKTLLFGVDVPGYSSLITIILFLGGVQLIGLGVMGEYIGRLYLESKRRPVYIIESDTKC